MQLIIAYDDKQEKIQNQNDIEEITKKAKLGPLTVKIEKSCYSVKQEQYNNTFSIYITSSTIISARVIKIQQQLNVLLNGSNSINDNSAVANNYANMFATYAKDKLEEIEKEEKLLADTEKEANELQAKITGIYNDQYPADTDVSAYYKNMMFNFKLTKRRVTELKNKSYINNRHIRHTYKNYLEGIKYITEDSPNLYKSLYDMSYNRVYIDHQLNLAIQVKKLSDELIQLAKKENATIVFLGRSLIACAAYIEKSHTDIEVIKIPASNLPYLKKAMSTVTAKNIHDYFNSYFKTASADKKLLIADYIHSGISLETTRDFMQESVYNNRILFLAVYSQFSSLINFTPSRLVRESIVKSLSFDCILPTSDNGAKDLGLALMMSSFDGISPFGKHSINNIIRGFSVPNWSEDGFNILGELTEIVQSYSFSEE